MKRIWKIALWVLLVVFLVSGCEKDVISSYFDDDSGNLTEKKKDDTGSKKGTENFRIHFIDVGQGDATLIESGESSMLIDAGENNQGKSVVQYIKEQGISTLDYVIGTHPHSDHIGGLDDVIEAFDVKTVILPDVTHTSKTFEDVLDAIDAKGLEITIAKPGDNYGLGEGEFTVIAPVEEYGNDYNNWSVGVKITNGSHSFVFTGDAELGAESDIYNNKIALDADVFHLGHHGSYTSNSEELLDAIDPDYVVISVGKDNMYGHPHKEVLDRLAKMGVEVYRTDLSGTVILESDGKEKISFDGKPDKKKVPGNEKKAGSKDKHKIAEDEVESIDKDYVINTNTKKIHLPSCSGVKQIKPENYQETDQIDSLLDQGYDKCKTCKP